MSLTVITKNGGVDVNTSQKVIQLPVTWDEMVAAFGRGYNYPQPTGQTTVFRTGDDPDIEATVFAPIRVANSLKVQNSLVDFLTLGNTNSFGNTDRFTDINGLQIYADDGIIDNYTGLMWYRIPFFGIWNAAIDGALSSIQNSFSDWFLPNVLHLSSIFNHNSVISLNYAPFSITAATIHTSTTDPEATANMFFSRQSSHSNGLIDSVGKGANVSYIICRKHF